VPDQEADDKSDGTGTPDLGSSSQEVPEDDSEEEALHAFSNFFKKM